MTTRKNALPLALFAAIAASAPATAPAQTTSVCPDGTTVCAPQTQEMGDTTETNSVDNSTSEATQLNPSANTNNSGDVITDVNNKAQASTHTGDVSATGGSANGNTSDNKSSASANNSMGQSNTGNSSSSTGASNSVSKGGSVGNTTAQGGAGGSGGSSVAKGGAGGSIADSGNSRLTDVGNASSAQGQQQRSDATGGQGGASTVRTGGATGGTSGANALGGTSGGNTIDTRNQSTSVSNVSYRTQFIPSITQAAPIAIVPGSQLQKDQSTCGPRKVVIKTPAEVMVKGLWRARIRTVGYNYELQDAEQPWRIVRMPDGSTRAYGHEVVEWSAVRNVSTASSLQIGGGGTGGDWGQAGIGGSGAIQDIQTRPTLRDCEVSYSPVIVEKIVPQIVETVRYIKPPVRKAKKRKPNPCLQQAIAECKVPGRGNIR